MSHNHYEVVVWSRTPAQATGPTFTELDRIIVSGGDGGDGGLSWSHGLFDDGSLTVTTDPTKIADSIGPKLLNLATNPMEMGLYRNGTLVQRGPIIAWQLQGKSLVLIARGLLYYIRYMKVTSTLTYSAVAQGTIVKGLIDHHQNKDYGNFGLDTTSISATAVTRTREYEAEDLVDIYDEILEMGQATDGFDIKVDPSTRDITIHNPSVGTDKSDSVILDERTIVVPSVSATIAAGQFATAALTAGINKDGTHLTSAQTDTTARNAWGLAYVAHSVVGVGNQTELDNIASQTVAIVKSQLIGPNKNFDSVTGMDYDAFAPGDTISYEYDTGFGRIKYDARVKQQWVSVTDAGAEQLTVEFV